MWIPYNSLIANLTILFLKLHNLYAPEKEIRVDRPKHLAAMDLQKRDDRLLRPQSPLDGDPVTTAPLTQQIPKIHHSAVDPGPRQVKKPVRGPSHLNRQTEERRQVHVRG